LLRDPSGKSIRGTVIQRPHLPVSSLPLPTASPLARATGDSSMDSAANSVRITLTFAHARAAALACDARVMLQEGRWSDLVRALFSWRLDADSMELMAVQLERAQEFAGSEGPPFHGAAEVDQLLHLAALCGGTRGF
jgi:hypothetical protein